MKDIKYNALDVIFEVVQHHAGSGNSTWIFEAAKRNPKCNIMCASNILAVERQREFEEWFRKENKRSPKPKETPHFFAIGGLFYHSKYSTAAPLILDNSCFDMRYLEEFKGLVREYEFDRAEEEFRKQLDKYHSSIFKIKKLIEDAWFIPFKSRILKRIDSIDMERIG